MGEQREIKFRGKSKRTGKLIYGDLLTSPNGLLKYIVQKQRVNSAFLDNLRPEEVEYDSIGEFTGERDKKRTGVYPVGQEIYERDVVNVHKVPLGCGSLEKWQEQSKEVIGTGLVSWSQEEAAFIIGGSRLGVYTGWDNLEVIGNIDENPELQERPNNGKRTNNP